MTYLIDVVTRYDVVEDTVEIIQQFDDLYRTTFRRQLCESNDIREVDRRARIQLWSHFTSRLQLIRNVTTITQITLPAITFSNTTYGIGDVLKNAPTRLL